MVVINPKAGLTAQRKDDHIDINLTQSVQAIGVTTGFEDVRFIHQALPEVNLADVSTGTTFLGAPVRAPILVSAMTGGTPRGWEITHRLAVAAQHHGLPMGVGSQRAAVEDPARVRFFQVRNAAPDVFLMANLGAVQLNLGYGVDACRRLVEMIEANALVLHLNPLQEALQAEGDTGFGKLLTRIEQVCRLVEVPVVVKEIGCGISGKVARQLADAGVAAIDVGGAGGTSWSGVEHYRSSSPVGRRVSATFAGWGIPTAISLRMVRSAAPNTPVIASGGLQNGLDAAKALALGAALAGFAGPLLRAADAGEEVLDDVLTATIEEVRLAMFCAGVTRVADLPSVPLMLPSEASIVSGAGQKGRA